MKKTEMSYGRRLLLAAAPAFLLAFTVLFVGPLDIVNANRAYLPFSAGELFLPMALLCLAVTAALAALIALAKDKLYRALLGFVFGIAIMFYVQGLFLDGHLTTLDGSGFRWQDAPAAAYINLVVWLAAVAACTAASVWMYDEAKLGILVLCAAAFVAQTAGLIGAWAPADESAVNYQLDGSNQMELSAKDNVIVITFDQMSPLVFEQTLELDPTMADTFKDFIYYDNMSAEYSLTFPSLCYLLTNQHYAVEQRITDYFDEAWHSERCERFFDTLHDKNYEVKLCLEANYAAYTAENMLGKADNVVEAGKMRVGGALVGRCVRMSLYRYAPTMLKNGCYISTGEVAAAAQYDSVVPQRLAADYYEAVREGVTLQDRQNCFAWYHVDGAHFPFNVGYDGEPLGYEAEETTENRVDQLHGYFVAAADFLQQMKDLGIYDDATIILSADHGFYDCFQAAFLIKLPGQSFGQMEVRHAPVAQADIMPTILACLGEDYADYGTTVFDWGEDDTRTRETWVWRYIEDYPAVPWIGNIDQWDAEENGFERYNVFCVLRYDGDRELLKEKEMEMYYGGIADEILPLTEAFY